MNAEEILQSFYAAYDAAREFDPKHPEDGVLSRKRDGLPPRPMNAEETQACVSLLESGKRTAEALDLLLNRVPSGTGDAARVKAGFLKRIACGNVTVDGFSPAAAVGWC